MINFISTNLGVSLDKIERFEKKNNLSLPKNYKSFLMKINGGYIDDENRDFLRSFNSLSNLEDAFNTFVVLEGLISKDFIPIAKTYSDNPVTLCLRKEEYGKIIVFYFDRDEEPDIVANSLENLLGVNSINEI